MAKRRILLVDDDRDLTVLLSSLLEIWDYEVSVACNGKDAFEKILKKPDLIILDRMLPDIEGLEVCRKIREEERYNDIPIIILSGRDSVDDKLDGFYIGADDYITKPFNTNELHARLQAFLRRKEFAEKEQEKSILAIEELKRIIGNEAIIPFFQPIFCHKTKETLALEALSQAPVNSFLSNSDRMVRASIEHGMYFELETLCWKKAVKRWQNLTPKKNLIVHCTPYFIESGRVNNNLFKEMKAPPDNIGVEISEKTPIKDLKTFAYQVSGAKDLGLKVIIGSIEAGNINIRDLAKIRPDFLKIDMGLIRDIASNVLKEKLMQHVVGFCGKNKIKVIVKGIENVEELAYLSKFDIHCVQGDILRKPSHDIEDNIFANKLI